MPALSVIIPTHKRAKLLTRCLEHLEKQSMATHLEVIVVSDGPDAETEKLCTERAWNVPVRYFSIEKSQQGVARNMGVTKASSPFCLFIGDDIFLMADACERHLKAHHKNEGLKMAVLGYVSWDPAVGITSAMRWLETSGWQFGFPLIEKYGNDFVPKEEQHRFTYTSNISLQTEIAKMHPFRTDVTEYGWEDVAWGETLAAHDIPLLYLPGARGLHHHHLTMKDSLHRMEVLGKALAKFPDSDRIPKGWKLWAYRINALLPTMGGRHRRAFLRGLQRR